MARHEVKAAHFVAHSFGTFVVAHTTHLYPDLVKSTLLCDPVWPHCCRDRHSFGCTTPLRYGKLVGAS